MSRSEKWDKEEEIRLIDNNSILNGTWKYLHTTKCLDDCCNGAITVTYQLENSNRKLFFRENGKLFVLSVDEKILGYFDTLESFRLPTAQQITEEQYTKTIHNK